MREVQAKEELITMLQIVTDSRDANTSKLDELMTLVQFANDEGDFGEGLELGLDLLAFHPSGASASEVFKKANRLNSRITCLLSTGYQLAGRPKFAHVVRRHMECRLQTRRLRTVG
ncbi:Histone PARylation factor 1 [Taenia crassiceps]|uniref:Histone PARylation factor 1 n=1 Tax=Taenia crassiceps TaxID=6207 RepID=A0ABR4QCC7_9CEST